MAVCLTVNVLLFPARDVLALDSISLPAPSGKAGLSSAFIPPTLKGLRIDPSEPFRFEFILEQGDGEFAEPQLKAESARLIRYFFAALTVPEQELWVNLSPYESNRIIPQAFGQTEMGRDLLSDDYLLKRLTASLLDPQTTEGAVFWKRVNKVLAEKFGTTDFPIDLLNKVWIIPDQAVVYEEGDKAFVGERRLKVMLDSDYSASGNLALDKDAEQQAQTGRDAQEYIKQAAREIVIPMLEKEVNEGKGFAHLRQVYASLILAAWYRSKVKNSLLSKVYVDRNKVAGIDLVDPAVSGRIWKQYVAAFQGGAFNRIEEEPDALTGEMLIKRYFSGGVDYAMSSNQYLKIMPLVKMPVQIAGKGLRKIKVVLKSAIKTVKEDPLARFTAISFGLTVFASNLLVGLLVYQRYDYVRQKTELETRLTYDYEQGVLNIADVLSEDQAANILLGEGDDFKKKGHPWADRVIRQAIDKLNVDWVFANAEHLLEYKEELKARALKERAAFLSHFDKFPKEWSWPSEVAHKIKEGQPEALLHFAWRLRGYPEFRDWVLNYMKEKEKTDPFKLLNYSNGLDEYGLTHYDLWKKRRQIIVEGLKEYFQNDRFIDWGSFVISSNSLFNSLRFPEIIKEMILSIDPMSLNEVGKRNLQLYQKAYDLGIMWPMRFKFDVLRQIIADRDNEFEQDEDPVLLLLAARADHNGAFANIGEGLVRDFSNNGYRVVYHEVTDVDSMLDIGHKLGDQSADVIAFMAHGSADDMLFGKKITVDDLGRLSPVGQVLKPGGAVVFYSCSTGKGQAKEYNMANAARIKMFRHAAEKGIFSPTEDFRRVKKWRFNPETNLLEDVEFQGGVKTYRAFQPPASPKAYDDAPYRYGQYVVQGYVQQEADAAMSFVNPQSPEQNLGGIDLNPVEKALSVKQKASASLSVDFDPALVQQYMAVPGFTPVIVNIQSIPSSVNYQE